MANKGKRRNMAVNNENQSKRENKCGNCEKCYFAEKCTYKK